MKYYMDSGEEGITEQERKLLLDAERFCFETCEDSDKDNASDRLLMKYLTRLARVRAKNAALGQAVEALRDILTTSVGTSAVACGQSRRNAIAALAALDAPEASP